MKICEYCRSENNDGANFCEHCGAPLNAANNSYDQDVVDTVYTQQSAQQEEAKPVKTGASPLSIVAFVLAFIIPVVGLVLGIIDVSQKDGREKGFSIAAICVSGVAIIILVVAVLIPLYWIVGAMI